VDRNLKVIAAAAEKIIKTNAIAIFLYLFFLLFLNNSSCIHAPPQLFLFHTVFIDLFLQNKLGQGDGSCPKMKKE